MSFAHALPLTHAVEGDPSPARKLRLVLAANAFTSTIGGIAGLAAAGWWSTELGVDNTMIVRIVSVALVVFGIDVALAAAKAGRRLGQAALAISAVDIVWVVASIVIVGAGWLSGFGTVVAVVLAVGVADFALAQLWFRRQLRA